jgi:hypothetical protein
MPPVTISNLRGLPIDIEHISKFSGRAQQLVGLFDRTAE